MLVTRLQVQGGANMTKQQFGVLYTNHFQANTDPVPSLLLQQGEQQRRNHCCQRMGPIFNLRNNASYYSTVFPCVNQI